ncbi:MAG: HEPN domain-containing protein [Anaerolineae bacterium]|nr:HEPN domain-containing protein [Anaerolineae bacterium]
MKAVTREWLNRAEDDLAAAGLLLSQSQLTNLAAFHAQQAVEKVLKAVLEESSGAAVKTHSLTRLYNLVESQMSVIDMDPDMLDRLEAVYIESRYPGEMGLLPYGKPTQTDASNFYDFAHQLYKQVAAALEGTQGNDSPEST